MADVTKASGSVNVGTAPFMMQSMVSSRDDYIKMMVYGSFGTGKTTLAGSAVDVESMRDVLLIDSEKGYLALLDNDQIDNAELITRISVTKFEQLAHIYEFLKKHCEIRDSRIDESYTEDDRDNRLRKLESMFSGVSAEDIAVPKKFRTVIIDSLTEIDAACLRELTGFEYKIGMDMSEDVETADWGIFRKNLMMMSTVLRHFRDLPINLILVCSDKMNQDERKRNSHLPDVTGQLRQFVQGIVDVVGFLVAGDTDTNTNIAERYLFIQPIRGVPVGNFAAKNRRSVYRENHFHNPNMERIMRGFKLVKDT